MFHAVKYCNLSENLTTQSKLINFIAFITFESQLPLFHLRPEKKPRFRNSGFLNLARNDLTRWFLTF